MIISQVSFSDFLSFFLSLFSHSVAGLMEFFSLILFKDNAFQDFLRIEVIKED